MTDTTVVPLPDDLRDAMRREMNKGLMVRFINADLIARAGLDIRRSVVLYDAHGLFEYAVSELPDDDMLARLYAATSVRFWSKGI